MALINLRNALMAGKRLPYDAEVEYLESTGTQWIDTGVIPSSNTSVEIGYKTADAQLNTVLFGRRVTYQGRSFCVWANANGKIRFDYASDSTDNKDGPNAIVGSWVDVAKRKEKNFVNSTEYTSNSVKSFACNGNAYLFALNDNGTANWLVSAQVSYCKIWDGDTIVRDFISVRKASVGYLYDRVSGKLFGNAGTGDFQYGPDVVPVEYLRGDGSSAIETDIQWQLKAAYTEVDFRMPDTRDSVSKRLLGSSAASFNYIAARRATRADYFGFNAATDPLLELVSGTQYKGAAWYENDLYNFSLNDSVATYSATVHGAAGSFCVFDAMRSSYEDTCFKGDISAVRIYADKTKAQLLNNLQAVRVGTEGAMMDVLTRRVYRNAGTGAFTYGNDLKYPIPVE